MRTSYGWALLCSRCGPGVGLERVAGVVGERHRAVAVGFLGGELGGLAGLDGLLVRPHSNSASFLVWRAAGLTPSARHDPSKTSRRITDLSLVAVAHPNPAV